MAIVDTLHSCRLFLLPLSIKHTCLLSFISSFGGNDHMDVGRSFFKTGGWRAGRNPSVFKAPASSGNEAKGYLAEENRASRPVLPGPRTKLKLAG